MDEIFFFQYHLHIDKFTWQKYGIIERKYLIDKYIQQKDMEQKHIEKESRKKR
jgi:hypothetical protein